MARTFNADMVGKGRWSSVRSGQVWSTGIQIVCVCVRERETETETETERDRETKEREIL